MADPGERLARWTAPERLLPVVVLVGLAVRLARVARQPLLHPDGPAYIELAAAVLRGEWSRVFANYYSPLYPLLIAPFVALGIEPELAARLAATTAAVATLPLVHAVARRAVGEGPAAVAVVVAAVHPALVKAAAQVQPETTAGLCVAAFVLVSWRARGAAGFAGAGALAALAYLARVEGVVLLALGAWWARRRPAMAALGIAVGLLVMAPALVTIHERTGAWRLSLREGAIALRAGVPDESSLLQAALDHPERLAARWGAGVFEQAKYTVVALGPVAAVGLAAGLPAVRAAGAWPLVVALAFLAGPLALNPSPRYAVPGLPLFLPWVAVGLLAIATRLGRRAVPVAAVVAAVLVVQCLWKSNAFDETCNREVADLVLARYGPGQALVAVDGRFAFAARGRAVVPRSTGPRVALQLAGEQQARLWLTRPHWLPRDFVPPPGAREVARPCEGAFVLWELAAPSAPRAPAP